MDSYHYKSLVDQITDNSMNKQGIVEAVHEVLGGTKAQAEEVVETVLNSIIETMKKGDEVSIAGLGIFSVKDRAARTARNPRTGEAIQVPAMKVPKFRPAKALKDAVK
ncbi:MAG: HU family DNA-binding protein [bacterium]|nr:HU family DNA-binding protein [bacterium]